MVIQSKAEQEVSIHGDMLESIMTHVPLADLVPACQVSKTWKHAVFYSLRKLNPIKPWLVVHTQRIRAPNTITGYAYDPRSRVWVEIKHACPVKSISALGSSNSTLLYMLSPSKFSFSLDPLHATWHHVDAPHMWRTDPVVAAVGTRVVVAGGTCEFEDDPLAVEMYDVERGAWEKCQPMPGIFKDCAASTWLSTASDGNKLYLMEKSSGVVHVFDPDRKTWTGPYDLRPNKSLICSVIGFANNHLILVGLSGDHDAIDDIKLWELNGESLELSSTIGEMPRHLLDKLKFEVSNVGSINISMISNFVYISNASEVVACEIGHGACKWSSVPNMVAQVDACKIAERVVYTCANVELRDLHWAMVSQGTKFLMKGRV